jgi:hypothetical protein
MSRDKAVRTGEMSRLRAGQPRNRGSILCKLRYFSSFPNHPDRLWFLLFSWTASSFTWLKRPGREADPSPHLHHVPSWRAQGRVYLDLYSHCLCMCSKFCPSLCMTRNFASSAFACCLFPLYLLKSMQFAEKYFKSISYMLIAVVLYVNCGRVLSRFSESRYE